MFLGDINCDFKRNTRFVQKIQQFLSELNLKKSWEKFDIDFTHFQDNNEVTFVSTIDHFFWNSTIENNILEAGVIHHRDNMSDHSPIYCLIDINTISNEASSEDIPPPNAKPSWKRATKEQKENFPSILNNHLSKISIPEEVKNCRDVHCRDANHCDKSDEFICKLLECIETSAAEALPTPKPKGSTPNLPKPVPVPGWKECVKPFRDTAYFWHQVWLSADRPMNTELHRIMKKIRNIYQFQYRKCIKAENLIIKNKLLDACINGNGDIFNEIKKLRKSKPIIAASMDGVKEDIPGHFRNIFSNLYNSANDQEALLDVLQEVESKIDETSLDDVDLVTGAVVQEASKNLNDSKSDPQLNFSSDCIKHGTKELFENLAMILKCFLIHGHVTYFLLLATLVPLIKDKLNK